MAEPVSGVVLVAKAAVQVLASEKGRKTVGWIVAGVLSPLIVGVVIIVAVLDGGSQHNNQTLHMAFYGGEYTENVPQEYQVFLDALQNDFMEIAEETSKINGLVESGYELDLIRLQSIYFVLTLALESGSNLNPNDFVNCFISYEERVRTVLDEDDNEVLEHYTVAVPCSLSQAYSNIESIGGIQITSELQEGISEVYLQVAGSGGGSGGDYLRGSGTATNIDVSDFVDPSTKNNLDLVTYAKWAYENGWGYVWGTYGLVLTPELYHSKLQQYPDGVGNYSSIIESLWLNRPTTDCVGLIKGYGWLDASTQTIAYGTNGMMDTNADGMYASAGRKGPITTIPEIPGLAVWCQGHIGVYIGNGEVIEAMGTSYGVVKTNLSERNFTHWLEIPYINYK